ncbi:MAG: hypothetical protein J6P40_07345 [Oscillospiraceae bacterium]|nr:hypothetical protein [Oscillospiraceae bacterium]
MERLITVKDIRERYGCSAPTARKYLRQMFHYENPLTAPAWALTEWERSRETMPSGISCQRTAAISYRKEQGRIIVPRKR